MVALANILGFFSIPLGFTNIHLMQFPIIFTGLLLGSLSGGVTGFLGAILMAYMLSPPNPYILFGNAILGFVTGLFYSNLRKMKRKSIMPQLLSVLGAYIIQTPYVYLTDVYLMPMPPQVVLSIILPKLLLEDLISVFLSHFILFRFDIEKLL